MDYNFINFIKTPNWQPNPIVFKIVWPILYILMFLSFFIFLKETAFLHGVRLKGTLIFLTQLTLNLVWSPIFFYYKKMFLALIVAVLLSLTVGVMVTYFWIKVPTAGILNLPYFMWLCFAVILNWKIWVLNR